MDPITKGQDVNSVNVYHNPPAGAFKYIRVGTLFVAYALFCLTARTFASRETGFILDILPLCLITITTAFFIGNWLYTKLNDPPSQCPEEMLWTHRRMLNSFLSNTAGTFVSQGTLSFSDLITGFILNQIGLFLQGATDNALGTSPTSHRSRLTHVLAYLAIATTAYMFAPSSLESTIFYFIRVYLRATFNTTVDVLASLLTSPPSRRNRISTLLLLLTFVSVSTLLLFRSQFLCPECTCPPELYSLIYTSACYSQIPLSDPRALHKTIACAEEYNLRSYVLGRSPGPVEVRRVLSLAAPRLERSCTPSDHSRAWTQACLSVSGVDRGHQFGSGMSGGVAKTIRIFSECGTRFEMNNRGLGVVEEAVTQEWGPMD